MSYLKFRPLTFAIKNGTVTSNRKYLYFFNILHISEFRLCAMTAQNFEGQKSFKFQECFPALLCVRKAVFTLVIWEVWKVSWSCERRNLRRSTEFLSSLGLLFSLSFSSALNLNRPKREIPDDSATLSKSCVIFKLF